MTVLKNLVESEQHAWASIDFMGEELDTNGARW